MTPKNFPQANVIYGEGQEEYQPLPAHKTKEGDVIVCWELTDEEIEKIKETKCLYLSIMTFGRFLQPVHMTVNKDELGI